MNFLGLLPGAVKLVGKLLGRGKEADIIADAIEGAPPELRAELQRAVMEHERQLRALDVEAIKALVTESIAASQSGDRFVSRARPAGLYLAYILSGAAIIALVLGATFDVGAVTVLVAPFWGAGGLYMYLRSGDKRAAGVLGDAARK